MGGASPADQGPLPRYEPTSPGKQKGASWPVPLVLARRRCVSSTSDLPPWVSLLPAPCPGTTNTKSPLLSANSESPYPFLNPYMLQLETQLRCSSQPQPSYASARTRFVPSPYTQLRITSLCSPVLYLGLGLSNRNRFKSPFSFPYIKLCIFIPVTGFAGCRG